MFLIEKSVRHDLARGSHNLSCRLDFYELQKPGACKVLEAAYGIASGCPLVMLLPPLTELYAIGLSKQALLARCLGADEVGEGS